MQFASPVRFQRASRVDGRARRMQGQTAEVLKTSRTIRPVALAACVACVTLSVGSAVAQQTALVHTRSPKSHRVNLSDPGLDERWTTPGFDDATWSVGSSAISPQRGAGSVFSRTKFLVTDPDEIDTLLLGGDFGGAIAVWINGTRVYRSPVPPAVESWSYESRRDLSARGIPALREGVNVLAVGAWADSGSASPLFLDPHLVANLTLPLSRGPYLQSASSEGIVVRWRTDEGGDSRVIYGPDPGQLSSSVVEPVVTTEHVVRLSGLDPGTRYYYAVGTSAEILAGGDPDHFFATSPAPGNRVPTRVWVLGDSGTGDANALAVRDAYYAYTVDRQTDLWLMLGDNAYSGGSDSDYQQALFNMYPEMLRQSCLWPTLGNHDGQSADSSSQSGPYYSIFTLPSQAEAGGLPSGTEAYYSFDHANIHFVVLDSHDSNRSPSGPMLTWLEQDLASTVQDWIIAYWHHPPYSKGSHNSDSESSLIAMRENALPVLEAHGVDLVLAGHSHSYERSFMIVGHHGHSGSLKAGMIVDGGDGREEGDGIYRKALLAEAGDGAIFTVAGSSGKTASGPLDHPVMVASLQVLGSVVLDVSALRLDAAFLDDDGVVRDHYTIDKSGESDPGDEPPPAPANLRVE